MKRKSQTIGFRVPNEIADSIDEARKAFGISRGDWVRGVVVRSLAAVNTQDDSQLDDVRCQLQSIFDNVTTNRLALKRVAYSLLVQAAQLSTDDAKQLTRSLFEDIEQHSGGEQ